MGKKRLEEAVRETMVNVEIYWRPFFLVTEPTERSELYSKEVEDLKTALKEFDKTLPTGSVESSLDAHRMLALAEVLGGHKLQTLLAEEIYSGLLDGSLDLVQVAKKAGINEAVAQQLVDDKTQLQDEVLRQQQQYQVDAIPHFIINDEVVHGAQHADYFVQVLNRAASEVILFRAAYA